MSVVCVYGLGLTLCVSVNVWGAFKCNILDQVKQCKEVVKQKKRPKKMLIHANFDFIHTKGLTKH